MNNITATAARVAGVVSFEELRQLGDAQLLAFFKDRLDNLQRNAMECGKALIVMKERGIPTDDLASALIIAGVRAVALGRLAEEAFSAFYDRQKLWKPLESLPREVQLRLVETGTVEVYDDRAGVADHRMLPVCDLRDAQIKMVFDVENSKIRTLEEQAVYLHGEHVEMRMKKPRRKFKNEGDGTCTIKGYTPKQIVAEFKRLGMI